MLDLILDVIGSSLMLIGAVFSFIAVIGLVKFSDPYLKLHAATKASTLGCGLVLFGLAIQMDNTHSITEIIFLIFFVAITNPISAHLIAKCLSNQDASKN